jgi:hypothetical protein
MSAHMRPKQSHCTSTSITRAHQSPKHTRTRTRTHARAHARTHAHTHTHGRRGLAGQNSLGEASGWMELSNGECSTHTHTHTHTQGDGGWQGKTV